MKNDGRNSGAGKCKTALSVSFLQFCIFHRSVRRSDRPKNSVSNSK